MLFILSFVYRAFQNDFDLVSDDYYEEEVNYDADKHKVENYKKLNSSITVEQVEKGVCLNFPNELTKPSNGKISFYRPDSKKYDRAYDLKLDLNNQQYFNFDQFYKGRYEITVEWQADQTEYIFEDQIIFE